MDRRMQGSFCFAKSVPIHHPRHDHPRHDQSRAFSRPDFHRSGVVVRQAVVLDTQQIQEWGCARGGDQSHDDQHGEQRR
jgi:hypothetical protein